MAAAGLAESESKQARAQKHEARRSQRQESTGDIITITHCTPAIPDVGPNNLKLSESAFEGGAASPTRDQALDRKPSNAWAIKIPALNRPKNAVTVSIIAKILCAPIANRTTWPAAQSKEFLIGIRNRTRVMIWRNSRKLWGAVAAPSLHGSPKQPIIHHISALPISAAFRLRYVHTLLRKWAASGDVVQLSDRT
jgi:hypothetical protein